MSSLPPSPTVERGRQFAESLVGSRPEWKMQEFTVEAAMSTPAVFAKPKPKTLHYLFAPNLSTLKRLCVLLKPLGYSGHENTGIVVESVPLYVFITPGPLFLATYHLMDHYSARLNMNGPVSCHGCRNQIEFNNRDKFRDTIQCLNCSSMCCMDCFQNAMMQRVFWKLNNMADHSSIKQFRCDKCDGELPDIWQNTASDMLKKVDEMK